MTERVAIAIVAAFFGAVLMLMVFLGVAAASSITERGMSSVTFLTHHGGSSGSW